MNTEQTSEPGAACRSARRAGRPGPAADHRHAAGGDASPSELAAMLAMPSNLLAHHLHVLEQAGIITRRRSEGDRRRTYLQLIPGALDSLAAPTARAGAGGCCSCAPPTPRARTWPPRCGAGPATSRRHRPEPIRRRRSIRARSPPPNATACRCPGCGPGTSARSGSDGDLVITVCDLAHEELGEAAGGALVRPRPGSGRRPGQLRRGASPASRRVGRLAPRLATVS